MAGVTIAAVVFYLWATWTLLMIARSLRAAAREARAAWRDADASRPGPMTATVHPDRNSYGNSRPPGDGPQSICAAPSSMGEAEGRISTRRTGNVGRLEHEMKDSDKAR